MNWKKIRFKERFAELGGKLGNIHGIKWILCKLNNSRYPGKINEIACNIPRNFFLNIFQSLAGFIAAKLIKIALYILKSIEEFYEN